jgi:hypothetical protein
MLVTRSHKSLERHDILLIVMQVTNELGVNQNEHFSMTLDVFFDIGRDNMHMLKLSKTLSPTNV